MLCKPLTSATVAVIAPCILTLDPASVIRMVQEEHVMVLARG